MQAGGVAQVVEHMLSNPQYHQKKKDPGPAVGHSSHQEDKGSSRDLLALGFSFFKEEIQMRTTDRAGC
jgi:hypothetical protein